MFKKNQSDEKFDTLLSDGTQFIGKLTAKGAIRIDGEVEGEVITEGSVFLGEKGKIKGKITASKVMVAGKVEGNIIASETLSLLNTANVYGDITTKHLIIDEGAILQGRSNMLENKEKKVEEI